MAALRAGFFLAAVLVDTFRDAELFDAAAVLAGLRAAGFLAAGLRAAGFLAAVLRAAGFLAAGFFATGFRAAGFLAAGFLAATLFAAGLFAAGFFAATFLAAGFLAAAALLVAAFLAAGLAGFLAAVFFAVAFVLFAFITLVPLPELSTLETCGSALVVHTERETNSEAPYDHDAKNRAWIFTLLSKPLFLKRNFPVEAIEEFDRYREGSSCEGDVQWTSISPAHS